MNRIVLGVVGLIIILIFAGEVLPDVIDATASDDYSENFAVTTGAGVTNTSETLSYDNYYTDTTGLTAESDNVADTPVIMNYLDDTNEVLVDGLAESDTRILTIGYSRESGTQFYGFGGFMRLLPFLIIVGGIVACIFGIYSGVKNRG